MFIGFRLYRYATIFHFLPTQGLCILASQCRSVALTNVVRAAHHSCGRPQNLNPFNFEIVESIEFYATDYVTQFSECDQGVYSGFSDDAPSHASITTFACHFSFFSGFSYGRTCRTERCRATHNGINDPACFVDVPFGNLILFESGADPGTFSGGMIKFS
jgi:hypothetical protein